MLAYYLHDLNPILVEFFKTSSGTPIAIRWYGLAYLLGFVVAYFLLRRLAKQGFLRMPPAKVPDMVLAGCIWGVLVGGRMGHVLFYDPKLLWDFSTNIPFWGVLKVWEGGMSAHGGVIGVILTLIIFARKNRFSIVNLGDATCMVVPVGILFGRIANFINGELYGRITSVPWAVKFPTELTNPTNGHIDPQVLTPQLQTAAATILDKVNNLRFDYNLSGLTLIENPLDPHTTERLGDFLGRFFYQPESYLRSNLVATTAHQEFLARAGQIHNEAAVQLANVLPPRHPSQLYEAALEGLLLFIICWLIGKAWRRDGMAGGAFLVLYPVMRIIGEQFRTGDAPPAFLAWTRLSQGEILSLLMLIPGLVYWIYMARRPRTIAPPAGGSS